MNKKRVTIAAIAAVVVIGITMPTMSFSECYATYGRGQKLTEDGVSTRMEKQISKACRHKSSWGFPTPIQSIVDALTPAARATPSFTIGKPFPEGYVPDFTDGGAK